MTGWLLVAGDFTPLGGMDRANHALACHLAGRGPVHLVTHRAAADLAAHPNVTVHRVARPFGRPLLGVAPERVRVVYLAVDPDRFPPVTAAERAAARATLGWDERPWVGFVGQLGNRVKNFDTLYPAWRELCRDPRWDANLAVVGSGGDLAAWAARAAADGLAGRVRFLGYRSDVPEVLAACDAVAHPARYDAYGLAAHEALCRGLPAVVSSAAGVSERYPPDLADLVLADPEDAGELAGRLRHWRANLESLAARVRPLADELRARTWADAARDVRDAILAAP